MAIKVKDLKTFLEQLDPDDYVGISNIIDLTSVNRFTSDLSMSQPKSSTGLSTRIH
jgi:hypothetical protein